MHGRKQPVHTGPLKWKVARFGSRVFVLMHSLAAAAGV
jgi:hypothetical protein